MRMEYLLWDETDEAMSVISIEELKHLGVPENVVSRLVAFARDDEEAVTPPGLETFNRRWGVL